MINRAKTEEALQAACTTLAIRECAACDEEGNCILTGSPCAEMLLNNRYTIADGAIRCNYFLTHVLPGDPEMNNLIFHLVWQERDLLSDGEEDPLTAKIKQCVDCGRCFLPTNNRQRRCKACRAKAHQRADASWHRNQYWQES